MILNLYKFIFVPNPNGFSRGERYFGQSCYCKLIKFTHVFKKPLLTLSTSKTKVSRFSRIRKLDIQYFYPNAADICVIM